MPWAGLHVVVHLKLELFAERARNYLCELKVVDLGLSAYVILVSNHALFKQEKNGGRDLGCGLF